MSAISNYNDKEKHMKYNRTTWLRAAAVRAIKTVAQTAIASVGTAALLSEVNWLALLSASALSGVLSLLTSLKGLPEVIPYNAYGEALSEGEEDGI